MTKEIQSAIKGFTEIIIDGVPILLGQNQTAFLSFLSSVAAIDALAGYRYTTDKVGERFQDFVKDYFPNTYASHAEKLYLFRCRLLHNFSPTYFTLVHANPVAHLAKSALGDTVLSDDVFFSDLKTAAEKFFDEVQSHIGRQDVMNARLNNLDKGGAIYY